MFVLFAAIEVTSESLNHLWQGTAISTEIYNGTYIYFATAAITNHHKLDVLASTNVLSDYPTEQKYLQAKDQNITKAVPLWRPWREIFLLCISIFKVACISLAHGCLCHIQTLHATTDQVGSLSHLSWPILSPPMSTFKDSGN